MLVQSIANTGALCCVAARPQGAKALPATRGRNSSIDGGEPQHWRTNSSYSPPPSRIWDCRLQLDSIPHGSYGNNLLPLSNRKGHRSRIGCDQFTSHQHSVSDGALSYTGSLSDSVQTSRRWTSPVQKFKVNDNSATMIGGSRSEASPYVRSIERSSAAKPAAASPSSGSPSSLSEFGHWESTNRQPCPAPSRHFSRRSHMSKAVYPLMFHNPVSDCDAFNDVDANSLGRLTPSDDQVSPPFWRENRPHSEGKFRGTPADLQRSEISPDLSTSSRREGFRWSSASSYDMGFDGDRYDMVDSIDVETLMSPCGPTTDQKCGVCGKLLFQKSPWCSHRIVRGNDMPIAGVLPCSHVFHADCLEHVTPKTQMHEPPCPLCLKYVGTLEESGAVSESLQMALRSLRRNRGVQISEAHGDEDLEVMDHVKDRESRSLTRGVRWMIGGSSIKDHLKRHLTFLGKGKKATEV